MFSKKFDREFLINFVGIVANLLNGGSLIPSIAHVYKTKDLDSYPVSFLATMVLANTLWILYGYLAKAPYTILMGVIFTAYYALFLYWKTKKE